MTARMDRAQSFNAHPRVTLSRLKAGVTEHLADIADVSSSFEHQGCDAMAQQVAASTLVDAGTHQVATYLAAQPIRANRSAGRGEKENVGCVASHEHGAH